MQAIERKLWHCLYRAETRKPFLSLQKLFSFWSIKSTKKIWSWAPLRTSVASLLFKIIYGNKQRKILCVFCYDRVKYSVIKRTDATACKWLGRTLYIISSESLPLCVICPALLLICVPRSAQILLTLTDSERRTCLCGCCESRCIWPVISVPSCQCWQQQRGSSCSSTSW